MKNDKELQESLASLTKDFNKLSQEMKAKYDSGDCEKDTEVGGIYGMIDNLASRINNISDQMYSHRNEHIKTMAAHTIGHLPPINSPEKMNKALASLGLDGDYEAVKKKTVKTGSDTEIAQSPVYACTSIASRRGIQIEFEIKAKV